MFKNKYFSKKNAKKATGNWANSLSINYFSDYFQH